MRAILIDEKRSILVVIENALRGEAACHVGAYPYPVLAPQPVETGHLDKSADGRSAQMTNGHVLITSTDGPRLQRAQNVASFHEILDCSRAQSDPARVAASCRSRSGIRSLYSDLAAMAAAQREPVSLGMTA